MKLGDTKLWLKGNYGNSLKIPELGLRCCSECLPGTHKNLEINSRILGSGSKQATPKYGSSIQEVEASGSLANLGKQ